MLGSVVDVCAAQSIGVGDQSQIDGALLGQGGIVELTGGSASGADAGSLADGSDRSCKRARRDGDSPVRHEVTEGASTESLQHDLWQRGATLLIAQDTVRRAQDTVEWASQDDRQWVRLCSQCQCEANCSWTQLLRSCGIEQTNGTNVLKFAAKLDIPVVFMHSPLITGVMYNRASKIVTAVTLQGTVVHFKQDKLVAFV